MAECSSTAAWHSDTFASQAEKAFLRPFALDAYFAASCAACSRRFSRADCFASHFLSVARAVLCASLWAASCSLTDFVSVVPLPARASLCVASAAAKARSASSFSVEALVTASSHRATSSFLADSMRSLSAAASASPFSLESSASNAVRAPFWAASSRATSVDASSTAFLSSFLR